MPKDDLNIETPGDAPVVDQAAPAGDDDTAASLTALQSENAQLRATVELLNQQLMDAADGQASYTPAATPKEPRLIGQNWGAMTAAEAKEAGCTQTVLCRDGYFVPA